MKHITLILTLLPMVASAQSVGRYDREYVTSMGTGGGTFYGDVHLPDDISICFGGTIAAPDYCIEYDSANGWMQIWTTDSDGGGTDADLIRFADGTADTDIIGSLNVAGQSHQDDLPTYTPSGTTQTVDLSDGNVQKVDLEDATGDVTLTLSNPATAARYLLIVQQDGGGGAHNLVWPATVNWKDAGTAPTVSTGNDAVDIIECVWDGSADYFCAYSQDFQ